jgi:hypothetical protein
MKHIVIFYILVFTLSWNNSTAQCCGGGGGSPIAGGASQGVLLEHQMEFNSNFQFINTERFLTGDIIDTSFSEKFMSKYIYTRLAYGLSKKLTISIETGYWINKSQILYDQLINDQPLKFSSSGIGDLIIFPRYDIYKKSKNAISTELTIGLGFKIPIGSYEDSLKIEDSFGDYYIPNILSVQNSSGANDFIFYSFFFRGNSIKKLNFFANAIYIKKGWNPLGEKMGNYASIGLFASKTIFKSLGISLQLKGEWLDQMELNDFIRLNAPPRNDPDATGFRKLQLVPQVSYNIKGRFTFYLSSEIPLYQYLFKTQIGSQNQVLLGIAYRFYPVDPTKNKEAISK